MSQKHHKRERKMLEEKWSQICEDNGWESEPRVPLAPKIRAMERKAQCLI